MIWLYLLGLAFFWCLMNREFISKKWHKYVGNLIKNSPHNVAPKREPSVYDDITFKGSGKIKAVFLNGLMQEQGIQCDYVFADDSKESIKFVHASDCGDIVTLVYDLPDKYSGTIGLTKNKIVEKTVIIA